MAASQEVTTGLYQKYRPKEVSEVVGQEAAVRQLVALMQGNTFPTAFLFSGPPGTGKTTLAYILMRHLNAEEGEQFELNSASCRGIDDVRRLAEVANYMPAPGRTRCWLLDECHMMTKEAQNALLKPLEKALPGRHYFLCTTEPEKLLPTIRGENSAGGRVTHIALKRIRDAEIQRLVMHVASEEGVPIGPLVAEKLADVAEGSARTALSALERVLHMSDDAERLAVLEKSFPVAQGIELCRALIGGSPWRQVQAVLKALDEEPEAVRRQVVGYAAKVLLSESSGPKLDRAGAVCLAFEKPFFDSGTANLVTACYRVVYSRRDGASAS